MRQLAYLGVAALSAVALVGVGCSSSDNNTTATGGATAPQGGGTSAGGTSSTGTGTHPAGGATSSSSTSGGASTGGAPAPGAGGSTSTAATNTGGAPMTAGQNLVNDTCQVNGGTDVMGVTGGFYVFGDGTSCTTPPSGTNVCDPADSGTTTGVCLSGATIKDSTYAAWGCGIGLSLNTVATDGDAGADGGTSDAGIADKHPYGGPATCFEVTFTGTTGGLDLRFGFTQYADSSIQSQSQAPFKPIRAFTNGWTGQVCFADVTCPTWATAAGQGCPGNMVATPSSSYDIQIQVPGGASANTYDFCLTSVVPLEPQTP